MNEMIEKYHSNYIFCLIPLSRIFYLLAFSIEYTCMVLNTKKITLYPFTSGTSDRRPGKLVGKNSSLIFQMT